MQESKMTSNTSNMTRIFFNFFVKILIIVNSKKLQEKNRQMNSKEIVELTSDIVQRYYQNDIQPFLDHVDENVLWYGPAKGQFLSGRQSVLNAWASESQSLSFSLGNICLDHISSHSSYCEVMMSFPVTTHYPDGEYITMDQIIHITWCERRLEEAAEKVPRMLVVHISDLYQKHEADTIYPVHLNEVYRGYLPVSEIGHRLHFQGVGSSELYLLPETILWVESTTYGRHSIFHTTNGDFKASAPTSVLEKEHPDFLLRCHKSYLVNPSHIVYVKRFDVTLTNGKTLPIPAKKYTAFKKSLYEKWEKMQKRGGEII
jgi:hypothetical protein